MNQRPSIPGTDGPSLASRESGAELANLLGIISESRWLITGIVAAVLVLGLAYAFLAPKTYEADTTLQVLTQQSGGLTGLETLSALVQGAAIPTEAEIELLQTRAVLVPVIHKERLDLSLENGTVPVIGWVQSRLCNPPARIGSFNVPTGLLDQPFVIRPLAGGHYRLFDPNGKFVLEGSVGRPAAGRVDADQGPGIVSLEIGSIASCTSGFEITRSSTGEAVEALIGRMSVREVGLQTGLVSVTLRGGSPAKVAAVANDIAQANVEQNIRQNSAQAARQLEFLKSQFADLNKQMQTAQAKLAVFLMQHPTMAALSQNAQYLVTQAAALEQEIGPLEAQSAMEKAALGAQSPRLAELSAELRALRSQRASLLSGIAKLPRDEQTLVNLQTDVTTAQNLYTSMLNQVQTLQVAKAGTVGDVVVVDPAITPFRPIAPKKSLDAALSVLLGLVLGLGAAFGRRALSQAVDDPEVIEDRLSLSVYAVLMHSSAQRRIDRARTADPASPLLLSLQKPDEPAIEGLRSLRTSLHLLAAPPNREVVCVTSLSPHEGKTFVSANLACLFAQSGLRVLLVDADLRRGHIHKLFGQTRGAGFAQLLKGEATLAQATRSTSIERLDILATGALPQDTGELLANGRIGPALSECSALYDLVVLDATPVMAVSDAFIVARHCSQNLLVVKYATHSVRQLRAGLRNFARHDIPIRGCVLNNVDQAAQRYAYRRYGYKYSYGYK
ncbi:MAG: polysaccharide biosynthesis tyrosine autokinase [Rhizomicrobium sp.]